MKRNQFTCLLVLGFTAAVFWGATCQSQAGSAESAKKIVFVHGAASHGYGGHAYGPAFRMLARILNENVPAVTAVVVQDDGDLSVLDTADAIVLGSDGGRLVKSLGDRLEPLMAKGLAWRVSTTRSIPPTRRRSSGSLHGLAAPTSDTGRSTRTGKPSSRPSPIIPLHAV